MTVIWETEHALSKGICRAFADGSGLEVRPISEFDSGNPTPSVVYGILRGCDDVIRACRAADVDYWHIDHGYFGIEGQYRVTKNGRFYHWRGETYPADRANKCVMGTVRKYMAGGDILICPPTAPQAHLDDTTPHRWTGEAVEYAAKNYPENPIVVCPKGRDTAARFPAAEALVTHNSTVGVKAAIAGLKVIAPYLKDAPEGDVDGWINALAYQEFSLAEMQSGMAWESVR
jgi:hypothetical protein